MEGCMKFLEARKIGEFNWKVNTYAYVVQKEGTICSSNSSSCTTNNTNNNQLDR